MSKKRLFQLAAQSFPDEAADGFAHACLYSLERKPRGKWDHLVTVEVLDDSDLREIERLTDESRRKDAVIAAAREMAKDYEAYEYQADSKDYNQPIHDPEILARFQAALSAVSTERET